MSIQNAPPFNNRTFVAMMAAFSGVSLPLTGLANHIYGFAPLSVARHAWMAAHNMMGILFAVFVVWHIVLNRRMLANHFRSAAAKLPRREAMLAGVIVTALLTLAAGHAFIAGGHA